MWLYHNNQGLWTLTEDWQISLFFLEQTITSKNWIIDKVIVLLFLVDNEPDEVSQLLLPETLCWESRDRRIGWVSDTRHAYVPLSTKVGMSWPQNISGDRLVAPVLSQCLTSRPSIRFQRLPSASVPETPLQFFSNATSSPAPKCYPHHPSIHLLPWLIDFLFSLFYRPPISLSSSSLHLLRRTFYSSVCLWEVLLNSHFSFFCRGLSYSIWSEFLLFDKVEAPAVLWTA